MGQQVIQLAPFYYEEAGKVQWDFMVGLHVHKGFIKDDSVIKHMKDTLPGWDLMCPAETHGVECPICQFRWDLADHMEKQGFGKERWKFPQFKDNGLWPQFRAIAQVVVHRSAGRFLAEDRGKKWAMSQRASLSDSESRLKSFLEGCSEAEKDHAAKAYPPGSLFLTTMRETQFDQIMQIAQNPDYGRVYHPTAGRPFTFTTHVDSKTGYREHTLIPNPNQSALVVNEDGTPDEAGTRELLTKVRDLRQYRAPWDDQVKQSVMERLAFLRSELMGGAYTGQMPDIEAEPPMYSREYHTDPHSAVSASSPYDEPPISPSELVIDAAPPEGVKSVDHQVIGNTTEVAPSKSTHSTSGNPTEQKGPDGNPICFKKSYIAGNPICDNCPLEMECCVACES